MRLIPQCVEGKRSSSPFFHRSFYSDGFLSWNGGSNISICAHITK